MSARDLSETLRGRDLLMLRCLEDTETLYYRSTRRRRRFTARLIMERVPPGAVRSTAGLSSTLDRLARMGYIERSPPHLGEPASYRLQRTDCHVCGGPVTQIPMLVYSPSTLAARRLEVGLSQRELATRVGCSQGAISHLECGRNKCPTPKLQVAIAQALEIESSQLWLPSTPPSNE